MKSGLKRKLIDHYAESYVDGLELSDLNEGMQALLKNGVVGLDDMDEPALKKEISWLYNDPSDYPKGLEGDEEAELMKFFGHRPLDSDE